MAANWNIAFDLKDTFADLCESVEFLELNGFKRA